MPDSRPDLRVPAFDEDYFSHAYGGSRGSYRARASAAKWRSVSDFVANTVPGYPSRALEVGCAEGTFLSEASRRYPNCRWTGIDVSAYALGETRRALPTAALCRCSVQRLPFAEASFDLVTAFDVLEHLTDLAGAVNEIRRVMRSKGHLVVSVPVYDGPIGFLVRALDHDRTHVHRRSRAWWLRGGLDECFRLLAWQGLWRYYYVGRYWHLRSERFRILAPAIVTVWELR